MKFVVNRIATVSNKKKRRDTTPAAINELITHITLAPRDRDKRRL